MELQRSSSVLRLRYSLEQWHVEFESEKEKAALYLASPDPAKVWLVSNTLYAFRLYLLFT